MFSLLIFVVTTDLLFLVAVAAVLVVTVAVAVVVLATSGGRSRRHPRALVDRWLLRGRGGREAESATRSFGCTRVSRDSDIPSSKEYALNHTMGSYYKVYSVIKLKDIGGLQRAVRCWRVWGLGFWP